MKLLNKICKARYLTSGGEAKVYTVIRGNDFLQQLMAERFVKKNPEDYIVVRGMAKGSADIMTWKRDNILEVL
tara:strand:+ start:202 stop:420 length:219 start_codon:yes stop_codon:yes gene_type:complete